MSRKPSLFCLFTSSPLRLCGSGNEMWKAGSVLPAAAECSARHGSPICKLPRARAKKQKQNSRAPFTSVRDHRSLCARWLKHSQLIPSRITLHWSTLVLRYISSVTTGLDVVVVWSLGKTCFYSAAHSSVNLHSLDFQKLCKKTPQIYSYPCLVTWDGKNSHPKSYLWSKLYL